MHADRCSLAGVAYACGVGTLGLAGDITGNPHFWLATFLCTLPLGIPAFVGMYLGYGLASGIGGLLVSTTTAGGEEAGWLTAVRITLIVVLPMVGAVGNVILLRLMLRSRGQRLRRLPAQG